MLDNLRGSSDNSFFQENEPAEKAPEQEPDREFQHRSFDQMTGTTATQRFILSLMLFLSVCLLGFMLLIFTGKIIPTFLQ